MEGLLPLIIMIVLSIVFSSKKKRKPRLPSEEHGPTTASDSPWDDLLRELRKAQEPGRTPEEIYGVPDGKKEEEMVFRMEPPTPVYSPDPQPVPEPVSTPPYFSYDEEKSPEEKPFLYDNYEVRIPAETALHPQAVSSIAPPEEEEPATVPAADREEEEGIFTNGFDPRLAVLYSEVFRPKYLER